MNIHIISRMDDYFYYEENDILDFNKNNEMIYTMKKANNILLNIPETHTNNDYKKIVYEIHDFLLKYCNHDVVIDNIDITPDKSKLIKYCEKCNITFND